MNYTTLFWENNYIYKYHVRCNMYYDFVHSAIFSILKHNKPITEWEIFEGEKERFLHDILSSVFVGCSSEDPPRNQRKSSMELTYTWFMIFTFFLKNQSKWHFLIDKVGYCFHTFYIIKSFGHDTCSFQFDLKTYKIRTCSLQFYFCSPKLNKVDLFIETKKHKY